MQEIILMPGRMHGLARQQSLRGWLAIMLLGAGGRLISWAWRVAPAARQGSDSHEFEFSPAADAEGGRIYADGQLLGTLAGVQRL
ncbi:hypothetical protein CDN99_18940 [Roseateles aquatilis]|uniref:Uncharacterized protein n=1 Tax=Roseateles aquatilis TaxID=431061 RepID=A0A246J2H3_9BURK|nr:hypothetical protein [Roseateles aquatilis]OWQ86796.1 hypothetical protein CDN99_18940 [Roseateles aquatilis]